MHLELLCCPEVTLISIVVGDRFCESIARRTGEIEYMRVFLSMERDCTCWTTNVTLLLSAPQAKDRSIGSMFDGREDNIPEKDVVARSPTIASPSVTPTAIHFHEKSTIENARRTSSKHHTPLRDGSMIFKSFQEHPPNTMFYRPPSQNLGPNSAQRVSLPELLQGMKAITDTFSAKPKIAEGPDDVDIDVPDGNTQKPIGYSFGMWEGVVIRCMQSILGVMIFLRLSWVVAEAGWGGALGVIVLSVSATSITTMSLSAICTNGEVKAGGAYYMLSRALGPEFGGSIGLAFYAANALSIALYLIGFAEAFGILLQQQGIDLITNNSTNDSRLFGYCAMVLVSFVAFVGGGKMEVFVQKVLFSVIVFALLVWFIGTVLSDGSNVAEDGITGLSISTFRDNIGSDYTSGTDFIEVFGVFFPAATGIMAGANISGDLKCPEKAIPLGTFIAIAITMAVYAFVALMLGASVNRETLVDFENNIVMVEIAVLSPIVYAGILAATLGSALAQIIGAPRVLMALARDRLFPFLIPFAKGYGPNDEPIPGYLLTLCIIVMAIAIGDLNSVSPYITQFFLASYAFVNYACFAQAISRSPGWRPSFKYFNLWLAAVGAVLCVASMILIDFISALVTMVICLALYKYVDVKGPCVNWGAAGEAFQYVTAVGAMWRLEKSLGHVKNFRPNYLVLIRNIDNAQHLIRFTTQLNGGRGGVIVGNVIIGSYEDKVNEHKEASKKSSLLVEKGIQAFSDITVAPTLLHGAESLMMISGMGKLRPNTLVLGYLRDWQNRPDTVLEEYVGIIRTAFGAGLSVCVLRGVDEVAAPTQKHSNAVIDVWWLADDGGHTILIPHLLRLHSTWKGCKFRVISVSSKVALTSEQVRMQHLLRKFRINAGMYD